MKNKLLILFTAAFYALAVIVAGAQKLSAVKQIRELNRDGRWTEAVELAKSFLIGNHAKSNWENCRILQSLIYAQTRLKQVNESENTQAVYDKLCRAGTLPPNVNLKMMKPRAAIGDNFWQIAEASNVGMSPAVLSSHQDLCERTGADACLIIKNGKIVQEIYSDRYRLPMYAMSSTKSITGILVGMLMDDGKIKTLDEPVCNYVKEWCTGEKGNVTLRHLLSMTSGLPRKYENGVGNISNKNPFVIAEPLAFKPGTTWNYSNEGVQLLSPILDRAAGEPIQDYARKRLFEPLEMRNTKLHLDSAGHAWTYADMETSARDFARIGILMINRGLWQNKRIVSQKWIDESVHPSQTLNSNYGFLWWRYEKLNGYGAQGYLDTNLYVFPESNLIIVRMQSKPLNPQISYESEALKLIAQMTQK